MPVLDAQLIRYRPGHRMARHADGRRRLSVLVAGDQEERERHGVERAEVGSVALKAPDLLHRNEFGRAGAVIVSVFLPDEALRELGHRPGRLREWRWVHGGAASRIGLGLASGLRRGDGFAVEESLHELLAGAFSGAGRRASGSAGGTLPENIRRVRDRLHDDPSAIPSVRALAREEGLHPVALGRLFRRHVGCSITRYRQRLRSAAAARALLAGEDTLTGIALDHGFADLAHFTRVFRRELGAPPGRFRSSLRLPAPGLESFKTGWTVAV